LASASAKDKSRANAAKRRAKIEEMVDNGTYIHNRVDRPIPRWEWGWGYRGFREDCFCADCLLMGENMVRCPGSVLC
jgi:hypothetical protein